MKKVLIIILLSLLMLPNLVKADAIYNDAVKYSNSYIDVFIEYDKYLIFPTKECRKSVTKWKRKLTSLTKTKQ